MLPSSDNVPPSRYVVGIDLGTTNSAAAYVDTAQTDWEVRDFAVPQLVGPGEVEKREVLPSFDYEAGAAEYGAGALRLPWDETGGDPKFAVGYFARDHGASVPGRLIVSAKSWLCHAGVDRTAPLLPWHGPADVERLSPVEVSARYLAHLRAAWDHTFPGFPLAEQDVVLTVPASFDEVARELTVDAAVRAGLAHVVLVEEPQAAFYDWIDTHRADWHTRVQPGQKILVCDIGGGTTDFTLIRVRRAEGGKVLFHRIAVGEHLILGGDNLDLALAHHIEKKLVGGWALEPRRWGPLVRLCRQVKETLLGKDAPAKLTVNVPGAGSRLIGGGTQVELTREEVEQVLVEGFLPRVPLDAKPGVRRSGFQEFGLPYAPDAAITRYLAAFLTAHRHVGVDEKDPPKGDHDPARPDIVLFNGGLFASPVLRQRLLNVLEGWFAPSLAPVLRGEGSAFGSSILEIRSSKVVRTSNFELPSTFEFRDSSFSSADPSPQPSPLSTGERGPEQSRGVLPRDAAPSRSVTDWSPLVLRNDRLDLAVARGAAHYGMVRRGHGVRISGGLAQSYYIGAETTGQESALCLLPAGVEEGHGADLAGRKFDLLIRQPVQFPLFVSSTRTTDKPGDLVAVDPLQMSSLPPIRTVLHSGKKAAADTVAVTLHARRTEIGTLDLWCAELKGDRIWRLQFDVRSATRPGMARHGGEAESQGFVDEAVQGECTSLIRAAFRRSSAPADRPEGLVKRLEAATSMSRNEWPSSLMRRFWETLMEVEEGRRLSEIHEARWLNLLGFSLRPGYGLAVDDWRVGQTWRLFPGKVFHPKNEPCLAEWWVLWRRLAGGLSQGQQQTLAEPLILGLKRYIKARFEGKGGGSSSQFGPHELVEAWRVLGAMELLKTPTKLEIGEMLLDFLPREKAAAVREAAAWAIGRLGARVPVYGPLNMLLPMEDVEKWTRRLIDAAVPTPVDFALVQMTRLTGDRYRDVSPPVRQAVLDWLKQRGAAEHSIQLVREGGELQESEQRSVFGESLPRGLRIE